MLSDKEKRETYDRFGTVNPQQVPWARRESRRERQYTYTGGSNVDFGDLGDIFGSCLGGSAAARGDPRTAMSAVPFGGAAPDRSAVRTSSRRSASRLQEAYTGATRLITKGERTVRVNIPAGAKTGTKVRLAR